MDQMQAILYDMKARQAELSESSLEYSSAWSTIGVILSVMAVNSLIIAFFSFKLKLIFKKFK